MNSDMNFMNSWIHEFRNEFIKFISEFMNSWIHDEFMHEFMISYYEFMNSDSWYEFILWIHEFIIWIHEFTMNSWIHIWIHEFTYEPA